MLVTLHYTCPVPYYFPLVSTIISSTRLHEAVVSTRLLAGWRRAWNSGNDIHRRGLPPAHITDVARAAAANAVGPTGSDRNHENTLLQALVGGDEVSGGVHSFSDIHGRCTSHRDDHCSLCHCCSWS